MAVRSGLAKHENQSCAIFNLCNTCSSLPLSVQPLMLLSSDRACALTCGIVASLLTTLNLANYDAEESGENLCVCLPTQPLDAGTITGCEHAYSARSHLSSEDTSPLSHPLPQGRSTLLKLSVLLAWSLPNGFHQRQVSTGEMFQLFWLSLLLLTKRGQRTIAAEKVGTKR